MMKNLINNYKAVKKERLSMDWFWLWIFFTLKAWVKLAPALLIRAPIMVPVSMWLGLLLICQVCIDLLIKGSGWLFDVTRMNRVFNIDLNAYYADRIQLAKDFDKTVRITRQMRQNRET